MNDTAVTVLLLLGCVMGAAIFGAVSFRLLRGSRPDGRT